MKVIVSLAFILLCVNSYAVQWDYKEVSYGPEARQWMNIAVPNTTEPSGILFWSHANKGDPNSMVQETANTMLETGYAVVSWGSVGKLRSGAGIETGWADAQVVFDYVRANAATWNMDPDKIIIMGRSRGSIVSWKLAHSGHPAIVGIYMYNALPKRVWPNKVWTDAVTTNSPPTYLVYGPALGSSDNHAPDNVAPVESAYMALGISHRFTLYDDMWGDFRDSNRDWTNQYWTGHYFPELVATIESNSGPNSTAPVITLNGISTVTINQDGTYTDASGNNVIATRTVNADDTQAVHVKQNKGSGGSMYLLTLLLVIISRVDKVATKRFKPVKINFPC